MRANYGSIKGQDKLINRLKSAAKSGSISHAYIFDGAEGMGKMLLANAFAKTMVCEAGGSEPCGTCSACRTFDSGNNPDVIYVTHQKKAVTVEDIRTQVLEKAVIRPFKYRRKVFIIDDADLMNVQAQNAFLKTLEEPASYVTFLLLSENSSKFLSTIISRCVIFRLMRVPDGIIKEHLMTNYGADAGTAAFCCTFADGSIGRAEELYNSEDFKSLRDYTVDMTERLNDADMTKMYKILAELEGKKDDMTRILDIMLIVYRDALMICTGADSFILQPDKIQTAEKLAKKGTAYVIKSMDEIQSAQSDLRQNADLQLTIEKMLLNIKLVKQ